MYMLLFSWDGFGGRSQDTQTGKPHIVLPYLNPRPVGGGPKRPPPVYFPQYLPKRCR